MPPPRTERPTPHPPAGTRTERAALALYGAGMWLVQPLLRRKLRRRARAEPGYAEAVPERFGRYATPAPSLEEGRLWIHAVSLGETRTAGLLIEALRARIPELRVLLTHGTATGRAEGQRHLRDGDLQSWLPWDTPGAVQRFLRHFRPGMGLLIETEVWPNLVRHCMQQGVPLWLVNARLNPRSLAGIEKGRALMAPAYRGLGAVLAQTETDAQRLRQVGAPVRAVTGNIKFDARPDAAQCQRGQQWRAAWQALGGRPIALLASSREGEEAQWLQALAAQPQAHAVQWLVVPRHPQRFDEVAALLAQHGWAVRRRSQWGETGPAGGETGVNTVWIGDSMGEMALYYSLAQVALLGASFEPLGGQNLIEACACGCPVLMGPHTFNFAQAADDAVAVGAALRVATLSEAVAEAAALLLGDVPRLQQMQQQANQFAQTHHGALAALADAVALALHQQAAQAGRGSQR